MTLRQLRRKIRKELRKGASYAIVANSLNISKPEVGRILKGHYPGEKIAAVLGLPVKCHACKRRMPKQKQQKQASALLPHDLWWRSLSPAARQEIIKSMYQTAGAF